MLVKYTDTAHIMYMYIKVFLYLYICTCTCSILSQLTLSPLKMSESN